MPAPTKDTIPTDKTPPAASHALIDEIKENYLEQMKQLAEQFWGEGYGPKWKVWLKANFDFNNSKEITVAKRELIIAKLKEMIELK